ncbi:hypothetical protein [Tropicimonas sediminicola]|uniref:Uncharacterized protein n=1 Tax=Tropicimonas sediminicola TaxID=1031541 RepID=A0A239EK89_9RHOB|nr:hypothetical protein [Tropicimonas sediminicola]SNS44698.1 hypothetical protein SAMN05421757_102183 [Tropicimonas sediminicola]
MKSTLALAGLLVALSLTTARAAHNNPWASEGDTLLGQNHDENQEFSADRPGEDEMRGVEKSRGRDNVTGPKGKRSK